jgi:hypothetical protein
MIVCKDYTLLFDLLNEVYKLGDFPLVDNNVTNALSYSTYVNVKESPTLKL